MAIDKVFSDIRGNRPSDNSTMGNVWECSTVSYSITFSPALTLKFPEGVSEILGSIGDWRHRAKIRTIGVTTSSRE